MQGPGPLPPRPAPGGPGIPPTRRAAPPLSAVSPLWSRPPPAAGQRPRRRRRRTTAVPAPAHSHPTTAVPPSTRDPRGWWDNPSAAAILPAFAALAPRTTGERPHALLVLRSRWLAASASSTTAAVPSSPFAPSLCRGLPTIIAVTFIALRDRLPSSSRRPSSAAAPLAATSATATAAAPIPATRPPAEGAAELLRIGAGCRDGRAAGPAGAHLVLLDGTHAAGVTPAASLFLRATGSAPLSYVLRWHVAHRSVWCGNFLTRCGR